MSLVFQIFGHKSNESLGKFWPDGGTRWRIIKVIKIYPERKIYVFTNFHGNPSNSCWNISILTIVARIVFFPFLHSDWFSPDWESLTSVLCVNLIWFVEGSDDILRFYKTKFTWQTSSEHHVTLRINWSYSYDFSSFWVWVKRWCCNSTLLCVLCLLQLSSFAYWAKMED